MHLFWMPIKLSSKVGENQKKKKKETIKATKNYTQTQQATYAVEHSQNRK